MTPVDEPIHVQRCISETNSGSSLVVGAHESLSTPFRKSVRSSRARPVGLALMLALLADTALTSQARYGRTRRS